MAKEGMINMPKPKLLILYYSMSGTNYQLASWAKDEAEKLGSEVKLVKVPELAPKAVIDSVPSWKAFTEKTAHIPEAHLDDLAWADAYLFSVPTRFGYMASQMKQFIDTAGGPWSKGVMANKAVSAMSSTQNAHGGQEATILSLYTTMYHWGSIVVAPGYLDPSVGKAGGNPYGTSVSVDQEGKMVEDVEDAVRYQTRRTLEVAEKLMK